MQAAGSLQKRSFDREPVALDQTVTADDLKIGVHMHQLGGRVVESQCVEDAGMRGAEAQLR